MIAATALLIVLLALEPTVGCRVEDAKVTVIPPDVARVVLTEECASVTCWRRWLQVADKRVGESRACEREHGNAGNAIEVTPR